MSITRETEIDEEPEVEVVEEIVYSIRPYNAENESSIDLVEGEKVYVIETHDSDWLLVKKLFTNEKGWVPSNILMDENNYRIYIQKTLNEKIDELPVFEREYIKYYCHNVFNCVKVVSFYILVFSMHRYF